jgi:hypothetical protein
MQKVLYVSSHASLVSLLKKNPIINSKRYTGQQNTWNYYILRIIHVHPDIKRIPWVDL